MSGFEALRSVILNKQDRFLLEYQKQRVIETNSESSHCPSSDEGIATGQLVPYGETEDRGHFIKKLHKYLGSYENNALQESQRRILLGV